MLASKCLKAFTGSMVLMVIISGCNAHEAKPVKGEAKTEYVNATSSEKVTLEGQRTLKVEGLKAQFEAEKKAEQERIAREKEEAERKAKEEAEAKAKAEAQTNPSNMGAVEKARWENNKFADVHQRANYLNSHRNHFNNIISSDEQVKAYLNALNDYLQTSGEMQTEALLNGEMEAYSQQ